MEGIYLFIVYALGNSYNFSTLYSDFKSHSAAPFPKCCLYNESISIVEERCIVADFDVGLPHKNTTPYLRRLNSRTYWRDSSSYLIDMWIPTQQILGNPKADKFFDDGSVNIRKGSESGHLPHGMFCLDVAGKDTNLLIYPFFVITDALSGVHPILKFILNLAIWVSFPLLVLTFIIYAIIPELREKVKNKCFLCYLVLLIFAKISVIIENIEFIDIHWMKGTYLIEHE